MAKEYSNQFPIGKRPIENQPPKLYNVEVWSGRTKLRTIYLNAPYAVCVVVRKKTSGAKIVPV